MKKFIIDQIEGSYAICEAEDKSTINIPKYKLPLDYKVGDCLIFNSNGMYQKVNEMANEKKNNIEKKIYKLINN